MRGKKPPPRVVYSNYTIWKQSDIERAAECFGMSPDEFIKGYKLEWAYKDLAPKLAQDKGISVEQLKRENPKLLIYNLYLAKNGKDRRDCPFLRKDVNGSTSCGLYPNWPDMCGDFPSPKNLNDNYDHYAEHCPGFSRDDNEE